MNDFFIYILFFLLKSKTSLSFSSLFVNKLFSYILYISLQSMSFNICHFSIIIVLLISSLSRVYAKVDIDTVPRIRVSVNVIFLISFS